MYSQRDEKKSAAPKLPGLSLKIYRLTNSRVSIDTKLKLHRRAYIFSGNSGSSHREKRLKLCSLLIQILPDSPITFFFGPFFEYRKDII